MNKNEQLLDFMAKACHYAQAHVGDPDTWSDDKTVREDLIQCVSYQMACFLAQNTKKGDGGVEWSVIIEELIDNETDKNGMMVKPVSEWKKILQAFVDDLGGWK